MNDLFNLKIIILEVDVHNIKNLCNLNLIKENQLIKFPHKLFQVLIYN